MSAAWDAAKAAQATVREMILDRIEAEDRAVDVRLHCGSHPACQDYQIARDRYASREAAQMPDAKVRAARLSMEHARISALNALAAHDDAERRWAADAIRLLREEWEVNRLACDVRFLRARTPALEEALAAARKRVRGEVAA